MAIVYAELIELNEFQEKIETTLSPLEIESTSQEELITNTKRKMEEALHLAEKSERIAEENLYAAQQRLSEAEARTAEINSKLEEGQEPVTTSDYYYEDVEDCALSMECATAKRCRIEEAISNFENYCRRYHDDQERLVSQYKNLLRESADFFEKYTEILIKAKEAILNNSDSSDNIYESHSSGTVVSSLDESDIEKIHAATGWDKETISRKCSSDGSIYTYRTVNADFENRLHTSGVYYERSKFEINGVCFEGVFPKFNATYEPKVMPRSLWTSSGNKYTSQFSYCNEQLRHDVAKDPTLASQFTNIQLNQIAAGKTPSGYTWHHHQEPGRMQLVRKKEHNVATGGAGHTGGGALWCK